MTNIKEIIDYLDSDKPLEVMTAYELGMVRYRFGMDSGGKSKTLAETGEVFQVSSLVIRNAERKALDAIKALGLIAA